MEKPKPPNNTADDRTCSLSTLRAQAGKPLRDVILEIYNGHLIENSNSTQFLNDLKCVLPVETNDRRLPSKHDAQARPVMLRLCSQNKGFVALSYPWDPSYGESIEDCGYFLPGSSVQVRDTILNRTIRFIRHKHLGDIVPFWIDQFSIDQKDDYKHELGMRSMDLVYKECKFAVGYLWVEMQTQVGMDHLCSLLSDRIVKDKSHQQFSALEEGINAKMVDEALRVLVQITDDQWWSRAWIFQEDYIAGTHMWLLIRHVSGLNKPSAGYDFGTLPGELIVDSATLRQYATLFCLALYRRGDQSLSARTACQKVLQKAGKYNILHKYGDECHTHPTLTMYILMDLCKRSISVPSDILPIIANVCGYNTRIQVATKGIPRISLSLATLTLCISNGEMLRNDKMEADRYGNILKFLEDHVVEIKPPFSDGALTFTKHCRLSVTSLAKDGIHTKGILWKLSDAIRPDSLQQSLLSNCKSPSQQDTYKNGLDDYQRARLLHLLAVLKQRKEQNKRRYKRLVDELTGYVQHPKQSIRQDNWPAEKHMNIMAACVVDAMDTGKYLQLARPAGDLSQRGTREPYLAVFVRDRDDMQCQGPAYVFTSWTRTKEQIGDAEKSKSIAKYVSLGVSVDRVTAHGQAVVRTRRWINGLCFFRGENKFPFVFPWPESLCE